MTQYETSDCERCVQFCLHSQNEEKISSSKREIMIFMHAVRCGAQARQSKRRSALKIKTDLVRIISKVCTSEKTDVIMWA